jgi:GNAT superfamily N-acetyltransferase
MSEIDDKLTVRTVAPDEMAALRDLRGRVLYPGLPEARQTYDGDDAFTTTHIGAFATDGTLVGLCSLFDLGETIQLRGMAVDNTLHKKGVGAQVLRAAEAFAHDAGKPLWCNARVIAVGFYERFGWRIEGEAFEVPDIGTHYIMRAPF